MPYAIWNKRYKKWLYGTDFRCMPHRQILDFYTPKLWMFDFEVGSEFKRRGCGKEYEIVEVKVVKEQDNE